MGNPKKKKLSLATASKRVAEIFDKYLAQIPPHERRERTERAHERLLARLAKRNAPASEGGGSSKSAQSNADPPVRFVARSHR